MSETHEAWLAEREAESRAKQARFMDGIAARLKRPRVTEAPPHPYRGAPEFWQGFTWPVEERIAEFSDNFHAAGGHVKRLADWNEVQSFLSAQMRELGAREVLRQDQAELAALELERMGAAAGARVSVWNSSSADSGSEEWTARAAQADIGIVVADYAAAHTGTVAVQSAGNKGRSVSLLPTVLVLIVPVERLVTRLGEILTELDARGRADLPAGIHFISGPSRSADIENDLTIGVHGPGIVYALIVG